MKLFSILAWLVMTPDTVHADVLQTLMGNGPGVAGMFKTICDHVFCQTSTNSGTASVIAVVRAITLFISSIIGGTAVAALVYAGMRISMSRGNTEGITEAKKIATWAMVGVALAIVAPAVMNWVAGVITAVTN